MEKYLNFKENRERLFGFKFDLVKNKL